MRSIVITGVSRGLGACLFHEFHGRGDRVVGLGRAFTDEQRDLARRTPDRVVLHQVDLSVPESLPGPADFASWLDGADRAVLIHNAAIIEPFGAIGTLDPVQLREAVAINMTAPMLLTNALFAAAPEARVGPPGLQLTVMFVSSSAAHRVSGGRSMYSATKRGAEMYFDALIQQYAGDPLVRVVCVDPGIMDTGMQVTIRSYANGDVYFPDRERFLERHARGELPDPADVARKIIAEHLG